MIPSKANRKLWTDNETVENFLNKLDSMPDTEEDIVLPLEFVSKRHKPETKEFESQPSNSKLSQLKKASRKTVASLEGNLSSEKLKEAVGKFRRRASVDVPTQQRKSR